MSTTEAVIIIQKTLEKQRCFQLMNHPRAFKEPLRTANDGPVENLRHLFLQESHGLSIRSDGYQA